MNTSTYYKSLPLTFLAYLKDKLVLKKPASILMYHSISESSEFHVVSQDNFEWQMQYLYENKYNVLSLDHLAELINSGHKIPKNSVVITFDDGYEDNYTNAFPILKKYKFPATIFLTTGWIGNKTYENKRGVRFPMLDWEQIREMHNSTLVDFEPHTASHAKLSSLSQEEIEKELAEPSSLIESKLDKKCQSFAYPYGDFNAQASALVRKYFRSIVTVERGFVGNTDSILALKRNSVDSLTTPLSFKLKI